MKVYLLFNLHFLQLKFNEHISLVFPILNSELVKSVDQNRRVRIAQSVAQDLGTGAH